MDHVFGYTIVNDVTARDVQLRHGQWDLGKSFDSFCPMGPWITTADAMDGRDTRVRGWVNGELRQDGQTRDMIFDIARLIETCSRGITLQPGDVIATGTPAGVGMGMNTTALAAGGRRGEDRDRRHRSIEQPVRVMALHSIDRMLGRGRGRGRHRALRAWPGRQFQHLHAAVARAGAPPGAAA